MSEDRKILRTIEPGPGNPDFMFFCPGCQSGHGVWTTKKNGVQAQWTFNGDMQKPTFSPSLLIRYNLWTPPITQENMAEWDKNPWPQKEVPFVCHSFVRDGIIQFLGDCTHALANKTVPLEPF